MAEDKTPETTIDSETADAAPLAHAEEPSTSAAAAEGQEPLSARDRAKARREQQKKAGLAADDDAKPLSQNQDALGEPVTLEVETGDKKPESFELSGSDVIQLKSLPVRATALDGQGISRVIVPTTDPWTPNPVHPDPAEVARLEVRSAALEAKRKERLASLGVDA